MHSIQQDAVVLGLVLLLVPGFPGTPAEGALAADGADNPDGWLQTEAAYPAGSGTPIDTNRFAQVSAELRDHRLVVTWAPPLPGGDDSASVMVSTDAPGHWAVRDWRPWTLQRTPAETLEARIPIASVATPILYFLRTSLGGSVQVSPMRQFLPGPAGVLEPTFPFLGHLEGFEEGPGGWQPITGRQDPDTMTLSTNACTGRHALRVEVPSGRASVTVGTVRLRGWMLLEHTPRSLALMVRAEHGPGRVRLTLQSHGRTPDLAVHPYASDFEVGPAWSRLEAPLSGFAGLRPESVDGLSLQFFADAGVALLVDDLELVLR